MTDAADYVELRNIAGDLWNEVEHVLREHWQNTDRASLIQFKLDRFTGHNERVRSGPASTGPDVHALLAYGIQHRIEVFCHDRDRQAMARIAHEAANRLMSDLLRAGIRDAAVFGSYEWGPVDLDEGGRPV